FVPPVGLAGRLRSAQPAAPAKQVAIKVDGDDDVRSHSSTGCDRYRVDQSAVDQPLLPITDWSEEAGQRDGGAHGIEQRTLLQPDLFAGLEIGSYSRVGPRQLFDEGIAPALPVEVQQPAPLDESADEEYIHIA